MSEDFAEEFLEVDEVIDPAEVKKCFHCGKIKNLEEFYDSAKAKDGKQVWCIDCTIQNNRDWWRKRQIEIETGETDRPKRLKKKSKGKKSSKRPIKVDQLWRENGNKDDFQEIGSITVYSTFVKVVLKTPEIEIEVRAKRNYRKVKK